MARNRRATDKRVTVVRNLSEGSQAWSVELECVFNGRKRCAELSLQYRPKRNERQALLDSWAKAITEYA